MIYLTESLQRTVSECRKDMIRNGHKGPIVVFRDTLNQVGALCNINGQSFLGEDVLPRIHSVFISRVGMVHLQEAWVADVVD